MTEDLMQQLKELERMFDHMARDCRTILDLVVELANEKKSSGTLISEGKVVERT